MTGSQGRTLRNDAPGESNCGDFDGGWQRERRLSMFSINHPSESTWKIRIESRLGRPRSVIVVVVVKDGRGGQNNAPDSLFPVVVAVRNCRQVVNAAIWSPTLRRGKTAIAERRSGLLGQTPVAIERDRGGHLPTYLHCHIWKPSLSDPLCKEIPWRRPQFSSSVLRKKWMFKRRDALAHFVVAPDRVPPSISLHSHSFQWLCSLGWMHHSSSPRDTTSPQLSFLKRISESVWYRRELHREKVPRRSL